MKLFFNQSFQGTRPVGEDYTPVSIRSSIEKTREALDSAYAGFDDALEADLIDSYIYEIYSLQKRYKHLTTLAAKAQTESKPDSDVHSSLRSLVSHVLS